LAGFLVNNKNQQSLADYLDQQVFAGQQCDTIAPTAEEVAGFERYLQNYQQFLAAEKAVE
jgi:hypothetical protein